MGDHDALGFAGGTRRVLQEGDRVAGKFRHPPVIRIAERFGVGGDPGDPVREPVVIGPSSERCTETLRGEHQPDVGVVEHAGRPLHAPTVVWQGSRHRNRPGVQAAEERTQEVDAVRVQQQDRPVPLGAGGQPGRDRPGVAVQLVERHHVLGELAADLAEVGVRAGACIPGNLRTDVRHEVGVPLPGGHHGPRGLGCEVDPVVQGAGRVVHGGLLPKSRPGVAARGHLYASARRAASTPPVCGDREPTDHGGAPCRSRVHARHPALPRPRGQGTLGGFRATLLPAPRQSRMCSDTAAALVGGSMLSTLIFPVAALRLRSGRRPASGSRRAMLE